MAIETTKLVELEKQKDTEKINASIPVYQLPPLQKNILKEIANTKYRKERFTLGPAIQKRIDQLKKKLLSYGAPAAADEKLDKIKLTVIKNQLNSEIKQEQDNQQRIDALLSIKTSQLEQLEKQNDQKINTDNETSPLTIAQKVLLDEIEKTKERKYEMTIRSAVTKTIIEQLQLQLKEITASLTPVPDNATDNAATSSNSGTASPTTDINTEAGNKAAS